jgi:diguanylate cyclase (GGDEF)-like protein
MALEATSDDEAAYGLFTEVAATAPPPPPARTPLAPTPDVEIGRGWDLQAIPRSKVWVGATDLRHLVDGNPDPLWVADARGLIRFANPAALQLLGESADRLIGTALPFAPDESAVKLTLRSAEPVELQLRWMQTYWDGNLAWVAFGRVGSEAAVAGPSDSQWEHRAVQAELRCEQLQEQMARLQDLLGNNEHSRMEQALQLEQRASEAERALEQVEQYRARLSQTETRVREVESTALENWRESEERTRDLQARLTQAIQQLELAEERSRQLQQQLHQIQQRSPADFDAESQRAERRLGEQLQRIQLLEAELESLRERAAPKDDSVWEEMRNQVTASREQALRAENRLAQMEQLLFEQEQKTRDADIRTESLIARLSQTENQHEEVRQGLQRQLEVVTAEEQETKRLAFEDQLTGLPNLNILQQYLEFTTNMVHRAEGAAILCVVDIDRLRSVNSTMGTSAGDELLRQFAGRLKALCRNTDVLGRRGDDEFLIVVAVQAREIPEARGTVAQIAQSLAAKILSACQEPFQLADTPVVATCSIGLTLFGDESIEQTLEQSTIALDRARELGRNRFHFFGPELQDRMRKRHQVVPRLQEALDRQEFVLHYQPIVDLRTGRMVGLESLLRWHDPKLGLLEPGQFLAAAESSGLIVPIGEWAVQEACLMAAQHRDLFVSVNLSPRQLMHGDFPRRFMKAVERARVKPEKIVVEISEATSSAQPELVAQVLAELARWNVGVAIDDFGTGSSNLLRLQKEKPRFLKIDHAFVTQLPDDRTSLHIVLAACHLAANLEMQSLAEGVENERQLQTLKKMNCHLAQGRFLSPPVGAPQIKELLRKTWKVT